jgi:hypothetical protein
MAKPPKALDETFKLMGKLASMPPKPHADSKIGKAKPAKRTSGKGRARVGKSKS